MDIQTIDYVEFVRTLCKPGETIAKEFSYKKACLINCCNNIMLITQAELEKVNYLFLTDTTPVTKGANRSEIAHDLHMTIGMHLEAAELYDAIKKVVIYNKEPDIKNITEELGDFEFYFTGYCFTNDPNEIHESGVLRASLNEIMNIFGITYEEVIAANKVKLAKRYEGLVYSDKAAQDRANKT